MANCAQPGAPGALQRWPAGGLAARGQEALLCIREKGSEHSSLPGVVKDEGAEGRGGPR